MKCEKQFVKSEHFLNFQIFLTPVLSYMMNLTCRKRWNILNIHLDHIQGVRKVMHQTDTTHGDGGGEQFEIGNPCPKSNRYAPVFNLIITYVWQRCACKTMGCDVWSCVCSSLHCDRYSSVAQRQGAGSPSRGSAVQIRQSFFFPPLIIFISFACSNF